MFTIYVKKTISPKFGENTFERYFKSWENAKRVMDKEVNEWNQDGAKIVRTFDRMNTAKGFYEYQKDLEWETEEGTYKATFALIDAYFQD